MDLTGKVFGRLTVVRRAGKRNKNTLWECKCECGNTHYAITSALNEGVVKSCGCSHALANKMRIIHGDSKRGKYHRLYQIWADMKQRCYNKKCKRYSDYGGRGIEICEEWNQYDAFKSWALANGYKDDLTLDRINVNGNYEPTNCRWATYSEQNNNTRNSFILTYNGESHTATEWSKRLGIPRTTIVGRIRKWHWPVGKALGFV